MRLLKYVVGLALVAGLAACGGGGGAPGLSAGVSNPLLTTAPESLTVSVGSAQDFSISGGKAPYKATTSNAQVALGGVNGTTLTVGGVAAGSATITVTDVDGKTNAKAVTVANLVALYTTAPTTLNLAPSSNATYTVGGGVPGYTVSSSDSRIAIASLSGTTLSINALAIGSTTITVRDLEGKTTVIAVVITNLVDLFTTVPPSVTVAIGASPVYSVGGGSGAGYTVTSSNAGVVSVSLAGTALTVTGVTVGSANVVVRDSVGASVTFSVSVGTLTLAVSPKNATGIINDVLIATITGGTPPFRASVGNTLVASASVQSSNELRIQLLQVGSTIVTVLDANNQSVAYEVTANAATPGIRLSPGAVAVSEFDTQSIVLTVYGAASGPINVFSSDVRLLAAAIVGQTVTVTTGTQLNRCVALNTPVTITVVDSTGATGVSTVTVTNSVSACP